MDNLIDDNALVLVVLAFVLGLTIYKTLRHRRQQRAQETLDRAADRYFHNPNR